MSDWDDDDFEIDLKQIDDKKVKELPDEKPVELAKSKTETVVNTGPKHVDPLNSFVGDIDRELTEAEKSELQRKSDLSLARELFGEKEDKLLIALDSLPDFKSFGEDIGGKLAKRVDNSFYVEMLCALLRTATNSMESSKVRNLSNFLKEIADKKSIKEKEEKKSVNNTRKASSKPSLKGTHKTTMRLKNYLDDVDDYDAYDLEDDFI